MALVSKQAKSVGELCKALKLRQPTVSHHLGLLRMTGVARGQRKGKRIFYSLNREKLTPVKKFLAKGDGAGYAVLAELRPLLAETEWAAEALEGLIEQFCRERELGMGKVAQPIRVAVTGRAVSPGIADTLTLLGKDKTLARIDRCLATRD